MENSAHIIRNELAALRIEKRINLKEITEKLSKMNLPKWLQSEIIQMANFNKYERITDPIEQAMEAAVHIHILNEIKSLTL